MIPVPNWKSDRVRGAIVVVPIPEQRVSFREITGMNRAKLILAEFGKDTPTLQTFMLIYWTGTGIMEVKNDT